MAEISLKAYIEYIESRLQRDAYDEVVAQCRHILETYPKYTEAYKLLGRAHLGKDNVQAALDLFQRVLSSDPNDFVAHIGMNDCYRETGAQEQALWHLLRAYEQVPGNAEIEIEIKRLLEKLDRPVPATLPKTGGTLARFYTKGGLHQQAIFELKKALETDPARLDLQVLLATALWNAHQEVPAGKLAGEILKKLPYSLEANRLLAQLWQKAGNEKEARPFVVRVQELDPYLGYQLDHGSKSAPADLFRLTTLEFGAASPSAPVPSSGDLMDVDWMSDMGTIEKSRGVTGPLNDPGDGSITDIFKDFDPTESFGPGPSSPPSAAEDVPDWLSDSLAASPPSGAGSVGLSMDNLFDDMMDIPAGGDTPDWLQDALSEDTPPGVRRVPDQTGGDDVPDWLQEVLEEPGGTPPPQAPASAPRPSAPDDDLPAWLQSADPPPGPDTEAALQAVGFETGTDDDADLPDWMRESAGPATPSSPTAAAADDIPDWLAESVGTPAPAPFSAPADEDELPDWLAGNDPPTGLLAEDQKPADAGPSPGRVTGVFEELEAWDDGEPSSEQPAQDSDLEGVSMVPPDSDNLFDDDIPDFMTDGDLDDSDAAIAWLEELAAKYDPDFQASDKSAAPAAPEAPPAAPAPEAPPPVSSPSAEDDLDWLRTPAEGSGASADEDLPDWMKDDEPAAAPVTAMAAEDEDEDEDLPDWMKDEEPAAAPVTAMAADDEDEDLPDWLKDDEPAAAPVTAMAADDEDEDLPDWMKDDEPAAAPVTAMAADDEDEDLPDWLKDDEPAAAPVTAMAADDEDEDDALAWLDSKAGEQGISAGAIASDVLTPESPPRPVDSLMPDPDAVAEAADDEDLPDWLKDVEISSEGAPVAAASALTDLDDEIEVEEGDLDWLDEAIGDDDEAEIGDLDALFGDEEEEEAEEEAPVPAAPPPIPEPEPTASWALLDADGEPEAVDVGLEAFLKTVESDEEEAPSPAPAPSTAPPAPVPAASAPPRSTSLLPEYRQEAIPVSDFGAKLAEARTAKDGGDTSTALTAYEALVSNGQMLDETVEDLRDLLRDKPSARANRVLGDALSAKGNIQEALDYYRRALDEL